MKDNEGLEKKVEKAITKERRFEDHPIKPNALALIPFVVFIAVYLGSGIILDMSGMEMAFYQFPAPLAAAIGAITAFILIRDSNFDEKFETFVKGCGDSNIIIMCIIYLMAGGFAATCKAMGGIDSTVNLGLTYIRRNTWRPVSSSSPALSPRRREHPSAVRLPSVLLP